MLLSPHFSYEELTSTQVRGVDNTPSAEVLANLRKTASSMEDVRSMLGKPVLVTSGYRSRRVNELVGGAISSAHTLGYACDFICPGYGTPLDVCRVLVGSGLKFDQSIEEGTWVHLSFAPAMRRQVLTKTSRGYAPGLPEDKPAQA